MKVIKRDGRAVDYDRMKIKIAIEKANQEVLAINRASSEEIKEIITYIEGLNKKRILVEDIQDIIEEKLMELKKYELAKKYIVYRYTRALVRKQNTTDETILGIIRNDSNNEYFEKDNMTAAMQRNYISAEVSRDLTKRLLLPEKIAKADEEGILYFHNADYFVHPMIGNTYINIGDMLDNGTVINGKMIGSPKRFLVACIVATQIIAGLSGNQYGGQTIDMSHFGKYLRKSHEEFRLQIEKEYKGKMSEEYIEDLTSKRVKSELELGIQMIQYQINVLETINGKKPVVTLFLYIKEDDEYIKENIMIIEEILKQRYQGIKNEEGIEITPEFPRLVYVLDENNSLQGGKYDYLTKLAIKCSLKRGYPRYLSAKKMRENYKGNVFGPIGETDFLTPIKNDKEEYVFEGRFSQGIVSINLPQIAIISDGDENKFWKLLDERLELCFEALMCRHYALIGIRSSISPLHWEYGALSRIEKEEKIDKMLLKNYSIITLGYMGIYETTKLIKGVSQAEKEGKDFAIKTIKHLKNTVEKWKKETNIEFVLSAINSKEVLTRFLSIDREKYGIIKDVTDKSCYTGSYYLAQNEELETYERLSIESEFINNSLGGAISYIKVDENIEGEELKKLMKYIYENIQYIKLIK